MGPTKILEDETLSALDWWQLAGVDVLVDDTPRDWLAKPPAPPPAAPTRLAPDSPAGSPPDAPRSHALESATPPPAPAAALPTDLAGIRAALAALDVPGAGDERLLPEGDVAAGLMLMVGMPEPEDGFAGHLLTGASGRLLDAMLGAIGRDRASIYLAPILPARPAGGRIDPAVAGEAVALARRHIALAAPRILLLVGDAACRALLGSGAAAARGRIHDLNHDGVNVRAIATFHPCALLEHPMQKAGAWQDLRLLLGEFLP